MARFVQVWWPVALAIAFGCVGFMVGRENAHKTLWPLADAAIKARVVERGMLGYGFCPSWRAMTADEYTTKECAALTKDTPHD